MNIPCPGERWIQFDEANNPFEPEEVTAKVIEVKINKSNEPWVKYIVGTGMSILGTPVYYYRSAKEFMEIYRRLSS